MHPAPHLVLVGAMGAGKTAIGRLLADRLGLPFVDLDAAIEQRAGTSVAAIFAHEGEAGFRLREREALAEALQGPACVVATGGGAVLAAENRALLRAQAFVVWLQVGFEAQRERLAHDRARPLLQVDDRDAVLRRLAEARAPLYAEVANLAIDTDDVPAPDLADALAARLRAQWRGNDAA